MKLLFKKTGETPLECLKKNYTNSKIPLTYVGRLDPMASGLLLILEGDECKERDEYLSLDKKYTYEGLIGVSTDSLDLMGKIRKTNKPQGDLNIKHSVQSLIGKISLPYPMFSSKTVGGRPLFELAKLGKKVDAPIKQMNIYNHKFISQEIIKGRDIANHAIDEISKVNGDFRQKEIIVGWKDFLDKYADEDFIKFKASLSVSSGTYVRSIIEEIGNRVEHPSCAFSILRTSIGKWDL